GVVHHFISPLWARTTWNSWMRSRFSAWLRSIRSASPRVPTSEKARSRCPSAKSSQAAINSRLSAARRSSSSRRQAGSTFRNVYLTKRLVGIESDDTREVRASWKKKLRTYAGRSYVERVEPVDRPAIVPLDQEVRDGLHGE